MPKDNRVEDSIPTGSFEISERTNRLLISHLGSCVGVILIDEINQIGGMYHILLPSPPQENISHFSLNFATSGMPQFIQNFKKAGADLRSTKAVIAGGALLGSISEVDLDLDIGGRTAGIAIKSIYDNDIAIAECVTGGYFASTMVLDLNDMSYKVENIGNVHSSRQELIEMSNDIDFDTAITRIRPVPQVALKISRMVESDHYSLQDVAKEIRNDPIISAKVIQLCNSSFMGIKQKISSVDQAVTLLGEKMLLKMILQSSMELFYQDIEKGYSLTKGGLYYHAMATASVAEQIAKVTQKAEPEIAYTAGLLHDIGKIVLDQFIAQVFPTFFDRIFNEKEDFLTVEENLIGMNHTAAGARLAELWKFPDPLVESIAYHHNPEKAKKYSKLAHIIYFADLIISRFNFGNEIERLNTHNFKNRLSVLDLDPTGFLELINTISWKEIYQYS